MIIIMIKLYDRIPEKTVSKFTFQVIPQYRFNPIDDAVIKGK